MSREQQEERRRHKRFKASPFPPSVASPSCKGLGEIIEVSRKGMSFRYLSPPEPFGPKREEAILMGDDDYWLTNVPLHTVSDTVVENGSVCGGPTVRRRSVRFGQLSREQSEKLEYFIKHNTSAEIG